MKRCHTSRGYTNFSNFTPTASQPALTRSPTWACLIFEASSICVGSASRVRTLLIRDYHIWPNSRTSSTCACPIPKSVTRPSRTLEGFTRLRELRLDGTDVSDAGLDQLKAMNSLLFLDLRRTKVSRAGFDRLKRARPDISIKYDARKPSIAGKAARE